VDRIDAWCDEADTPREYEARALLYETLRRAEATPVPAALAAAERIQTYVDWFDAHFDTDLVSKGPADSAGLLASDLRRVAALVRSAQNDTEPRRGYIHDPDPTGNHTPQRPGERLRSAQNDTDGGTDDD
jgi:hypothetical protein